MKKRVLATALAAFSLFAFVGCAVQKPDDADKTIKITDVLGRTVEVPDDVKNVVCIGAGALRLYSYVGDLDLLCGVEDVDKDGSGVGSNLALRPYKIAHAEKFNSLPSCGIGGPNNQSAETEKILTCKPDLIISSYNADVATADKIQNDTNTPVITVAYGKDKPYSEQITTSLTAIGKAVNAEKRAGEVIEYISSVKTKLSTTTANVKEEDKSSVYIGGNSYFGTQGFLSTSTNYATFNVSGIKNAVANASLTANTADWEALVSVYNPDKVIIDAGGVTNVKNQYNAPETKARFDEINAFKNDEVYLQMPFNAYETNIEIAICDSYFSAKVAFPDLFKDLDIVKKSREVIAFFNGADCYDELANKYYGGFQKISLSEFFK